MVRKLFGPMQFVLPIFLFLAFSICSGSTPISGIISSNALWTTANSPYIVTGNALIDQGITITILPGVQVLFMSGKSLQVNGTLVAKGSPDSLIIFSADTSSAVPGVWDSIYFAPPSTNAAFSSSGEYVSGCSMQNCLIEYGKRIVIRETSPLIDHCTVRSMGEIGINIVGNGGDTMRVSNSIITNNLGSGIKCDAQDVFIIFSNTISRNGYEGIVQTNAVSSIKAFQNLIIQNGKQGFFSYLGYNDAISNNVFSGNGGAIVAYGGDFSISGNSFINNSSDIIGAGEIFLMDLEYGDHLSVDLSKNTFTSNQSSKSIYLNNKWDPANNLVRLTATHNNLCDTAQYQIYCNTADDYNNQTNHVATNSYWGTTSDSVIQARIYDRNDDFSREYVDYLPFLNSPDTSAPMIPPAGFKKVGTAQGILLSWAPNRETDIKSIMVIHCNT